jgi:hypothetical protein
MDAADEKSCNAAFLRRAESKPKNRFLAGISATPQPGVSGVHLPFPRASRPFPSPFPSPAFEKKRRGLFDGGR